MPYVSVVLTVFNGEATLASTLESIAAQTFQDFEVLIVDDGSEDSTPEILSRYAALDSRYRITRTPNRGVAHAPNTALQRASGTLIARIDADDICHPERFARQADYLDRHPECVAVGSQVLLIDQDGVPLRKQPRLSRGMRMKDRCREFAYFPPSPPTVAHSTAMFRFSSFMSAGQYRPSFTSGSEDRDLWWRLMKQGEIHRIPERLVKYRLHPSNFSSVRRKELVTGALISDLSAVSRHFGLDDRPVLREYSPSTGSVTLLKYSQLIGDRYPSRALIYYRAARADLPDLASWIDKHSLRSETVRHLSIGPSILARWRLFQSAFF